MELLALHSLHESVGARFGELNGREIVMAYGGAASREYELARSKAALFDLSFRQTLRVRGDDRVTFLQGMLTQDIVGLPVRSATYAALLTPKGGIVADARILKRDEDLLIQLEPGFLTAANDFLQRHVISEDVEISDVSADFGMLGMVGPQSRSALGTALGVKLDASQAATPVDFNGERLWVVREDTWAESGFSVWVPRQKASDVAQRLAQATATPAAAWIGFETLEVLRVEAGAPRLGADMDESTLALEANLQHAISYSKGCYIGQEVIARATYRGHINRKLIGLVLGNELPPPRSDLLRDGKRVGGLTTSVHSPSQGGVIALAYLHRDCWEPGTRVEVANYPAGATVHALPFSR